MIDGNSIAKEIATSLKQQVGDCNHAPEMGIVVVSQNPVTQSYVTKKREFALDIGVPFVEKYLPEDISQERLIEEVTKFIAEVDGVVVQLPLPAHIDQTAILTLIPHTKDVDLLNPTSVTSLVVGPVAGAVLEILERHNISIHNKSIVVIGYGKLVGKPVAQALRERGCEVEVLKKETPNDEFLESVRGADIIISGAGVAQLITADMVQEGVVLIDAGTTSDSGEIVGDISHDCEAKALLFSQTPGGVGPITVAKLFQNLLTLYRS